jgi:hypothetical protein
MSTLPSSSPSSSFLTPIEHQQTTNSPNHENEIIPNQDELLPTPTIQSNVVDELEQ